MANDSPPDVAAKGMTDLGSTSSLVPMLVGGLVLTVIGMIAVLVFV